MQTNYKQIIPNVNENDTIKGSWKKYTNTRITDGQVDYIHDWRSFMSLEDLMRNVEQFNWCAVTVSIHDSCEYALLFH